MYSSLLLAYYHQAQSNSEQFLPPPLRAPQGGAIGFQGGAKTLIQKINKCVDNIIYFKSFFVLMKHSLDYTDKLLCSTEAEVIKIKASCESLCQKLCILVSYMFALSDFIKSKIAGNTKTEQ